LLAEAVGEPRRVALIDLLVEERAGDRPEAQRAGDRKAMTAMTIAGVLGAHPGSDLPRKQRRGNPG
jgi:hypothetical protein